MGFGIDMLRLRTPAAAGASGFGYETGDGSSVAFAIFETDHDSFQYTNNTGGTVLVATIRLIKITGTTSGITATVKAALYADNGSNAPGVLLGQSPTKSVAAVGGGVESQEDFALGSPVSVTNGTKVWVAFDALNASVSCNGSVRADDGRYRWKSRPGGGTFSDPFGATSTFGAIIPVRLLP